MLVEYKGLKLAAIPFESPFGLLKISIKTDFLSKIPLSSTTSQAHKKSLWTSLIEAKVVPTGNPSEEVDTDPLEEALSLEDQYYRRGYEEGFADGLKSGPTEGHDFGHEVAFHKFLPLGIVLGRCAIWKLSLSERDSKSTSSIAENKRTRALKQIETLEKMIMDMDRQNELEADHGKFEEAKRRIMSKSKIVESLMGEERQKSEEGTQDEDSVALAKRMDRELQL